MTVLFLAEIEHVSRYCMRTVWEAECGKMFPLRDERVKQTRAEDSVRTDLILYFPKSDRFIQDEIQASPICFVNTLVLVVNAVSPIVDLVQIDFMFMPKFYQAHCCNLFILIILIKIGELQTNGVREKEIIEKRGKR